MTSYLPRWEYPVPSTPSVCCETVSRDFHFPDPIALVPPRQKDEDSFQEIGAGSRLVPSLVGHRQGTEKSSRRVRLCTVRRSHPRLCRSYARTISRSSLCLRQRTGRVPAANALSTTPNHIRSALPLPHARTPNRPVFPLALSRESRTASPQCS